MNIRAHSLLHAIHDTTTTAYYLSQHSPSRTREAIKLLSIHIIKRKSKRPSTDMQIIGAPQASGPPVLVSTNSMTPSQTTSSSRRPSGQSMEPKRPSSKKPASLEPSDGSMTKPKSNDSEVESSPLLILDSINRKLGLFLDDVRDNGFVLRGSKHLVEAEDAKSLPPTPCSSKSLELTNLIPKTLSPTKHTTNLGSQRRKLSRPADAWKRIGSSEYRFV